MSPLLVYVLNPDNHMYMKYHKFQKVLCTPSFKVDEKREKNKLHFLFA